MSASSEGGDNLNSNEFHEINEISEIHQQRYTAAIPRIGTKPWVPADWRTLMIVWKSCEPEGVEVPNQYQHIRRRNAVVPFEPAKIAVAMMKAFLVVQETMKDMERSKTLFNGLSLFCFERVSAWRCQLRLLTIDFERPAAVHDVRVQRSSVKAGGGMRRGFFPAAKPNLRNAP